MAENGKAKETKEEKKNGRLRKEIELREHKLESTQSELTNKEKENKELKDQNTSLLRKLNSRAMEEKETKTEQIAVDSVSSTGAQLTNLAIQTGLNYLIKNVDFAGKHPVAVKSVPVGLTFLWYLIELLTMKKENKLPKRMRLQASTILTNLGFLHLAQQFSEDQGDKKAAALVMSQDNAALSAKYQKVQEELAAAKKLLKDKGLE